MDSNKNIKGDREGGERSLPETEVVQDAVKKATAERDQARQEAFRERLNILQMAAAVERAEARAKRAEAIEISTTWRLTAPFRRALAARPTLHRAVRTLIAAMAGKKNALRPPGASKKKALRSEGGQHSPAAREFVAPKLSKSPLFDVHHALRSEPLPEDASGCLVVPFGMPLSLRSTPRIAVMIHAFYIHQVPLILEHVRRIPIPADIFITTDTENKRDIIKSQLGELPDFRCEVRITPNRGRDIAPKLVGLADVYAGYDLLLHLHTKRSPHAVNGIDWFKYLLETLLGSEQIVMSILAAFEEQPRLGLLFADHWDPVRSWINWGYDYEIAQDLAVRMGFSMSRDQPLEFPSGSMFWARPQAVSPLLGLNLGFDNFAEEKGQVDGTLAHAIERLFLRVCEHSGHSWARLSRGTNRRAGSLRIDSKENLGEALKLHPVLLADPALRVAEHVLPDRPETWPMRAALDFEPRSRINLIIPTLRNSSLFGGIATAFALFERIADELGTDVDKRIVVTTEDNAIANSELPKGWSQSQVGDGGRLGQVVCIPRGDRVEHALPIRARDIFFASAWWDAAAAYGLMNLQRDFFGHSGRLRYFIQDYEPHFSAWSASWALAEATYHRPVETVALINSSFLADELGRQALRFSERHVFQPLWTESLGMPDPDYAEREDILIVYWRPYSERNLSTIIASALALWLEEDPYTADKWEIIAVGQAEANVQLTSWKTMSPFGKVSVRDYAKLMQRAKVGLALMLSPHPSYPPLEMAAFGMRVVTNNFGPKDMSRFGDRIDAVSEVAPHAIAAALKRATSAARDPERVTTFEYRSAFAAQKDISSLTRQIAEGIRIELEALRSGDPRA
jgi:hypothetical protein